MKKLLTLLLALVSLGSLQVQACIKRSAAHDKRTPVAVIVMDTTQALLHDAQVKVGSQTFKTSFDGRVILKPEQLKGVKSLTVTCDGFDAHKVKLDGSSVVLVSLTPKPIKESKHANRSEDVVFACTSAEMKMDARSSMVSGVYMTEMDVAAPMEMEEAEEVVKVGYSASIVPNNVSAGKLTAGEVNDFTKWYFWPKVMDESHAQFAKTWRIAPRHRYTVQVMNKNGHPLANYPVNLTDGNGNTIFQAVTDNTGKAELWYQLIGQHLCGKHTDFYLQVDGQKQIAKDWYEGMNTFVLDVACEANEDVDVVFVFDATGSMGDELHYLQAEMKDVIARAKNATGGLNIRTGAVVYRDHYDEYLTRISRLTDDITATQTFIDKQSAGGGGDYEEAVPEALMAALNSAGWNDQARARIAFLILDAPCHQDSATMALLHEQILNAAALGVRIVPVVCSGLGESGEYLLRSMALATNGTSFFLTDDSGIGHSHLKPTTDSLKVEHLNDMLVRTIVEFSTMPACEAQAENEQTTLDEQFIPNPFSKSELEADSTIPHGEGVHYLVDISGKLITIYEGEIDNYKTISLPIGVYFVKTYIDGQWFTQKIFNK